jgi:hypothetical protein
MSTVSSTGRWRCPLPRGLDRVVNVEQVTVNLPAAGTLRCCVDASVPGPWAFSLATAKRPGLWVDEPPRRTAVPPHRPAETCAARHHRPPGYRLMDDAVAVTTPLSSPKTAAV